MWFVYILECSDGTLYTGMTNNLPKRLKDHQAGKGGAYTKTHGAKKFVYSETCESRSAALKREAAIKKFSRDKKTQLIQMSG